MVSPDCRQDMPHLFAGLIAFGLVAVVLFGAEIAVVHLERTTIRASAPGLFSLKNQGLAFQRASTAWIDLELLLRTLASVHASPLFLSIPIAGDLYDRNGVSRSAREDYYLKLRELVQRYHFRLVEFEGHDEDPAFLYRHQSHLTAKGWIYYDRALDDFFHDRVPRS
jgi:poly-D-alanine transfer protein DltD